MPLFEPFYQHARCNCYCNFQIYLSSRSHVHRDLAARNVLLTNDMVAKVCNFAVNCKRRIGILRATFWSQILQISDFGMCRTLTTEEYTSKGGLLPLRWMAPESLQWMEFSTKSDVLVFIYHFDRE